MGQGGGDATNSGFLPELETKVSPRDWDVRDTTGNLPSPRRIVRRPYTGEVFASREDGEFVKREGEFGREGGPGRAPRMAYQSPLEGASRQMDDFWSQGVPELRQSPGQGEPQSRIMEAVKTAWVQDALKKNVPIMKAEFTCTLQWPECVKLAEWLVEWALRHQCTFSLVALMCRSKKVLMACLMDLDLRDEGEYETGVARTLNQTWLKRIMQASTSSDFNSEKME